MNAAVRRIHPPTIVEHCTYCHFYNLQERNLITAGSDQLSIYRLITETDLFNSGPSNDEAKDKNASANIPTLDEPSEYVKSDVRLECVQTFSLFGTVAAIESVHLQGAPRDTLLIAFEDAKLSVLEYDPSNHDLKTISMHHFEDNEMKGGFRQQFPNMSSVLRVDPEGRCAVLLIYGRSLIVIPFKRTVTSDFTLENDESMIHDDGVMETSTSGSSPKKRPLNRTPIQATYKLDLKEETYAEKISNIIDIRFLYGYMEPTLLILYEPIPTWPGRLAVRMDTCSIVAISLNIAQRVHPLIWSVNSLPFDCSTALAVPKPIGGVLLIAYNELIYLNQSVPTFAVSLNALTKDVTAFPLRVQEDVKIALDCAVATFITNDKLVVSLKTGDIYVITLQTEDVRNMKSFHFHRAASSVLASCITKCEDGYLFLGSHLANSMLLKYREVSASQGTMSNGGIITTETAFTSGALPGLADDDDENSKEAVGTKSDETSTTPTPAAVSQVPQSLFADLTNDLDDDIYGDAGSGSPVPPTQPSSHANLNGGGDAMNAEQEQKTLKREHAVDETTSTESESSSSSSSEEEEPEEKRRRESQLDDVSEIKQEKTDAQQDNNNGSDTVPDPATDDIGHWMAKDVALNRRDDDLIIYGEEEQFADYRPLVTTYEFELCDTIVNVGPCGKFSVGENAFLSSELQRDGEFNLELLTTSGYGKNGALSVMQRTVRPQVLITYRVPDVTGIWTVYGSASHGDSDVDYDPQVHEFILLSRSDSTMVLQAGREINELDGTGFNSDTNTLLVGNLHENRFIVQIYPLGIRLLQGSDKLHQVPIDLLDPVVSCSLADPYLVLLTESGNLIHVSVRDPTSDTQASTGGGPHFVVGQPQLSPATSPITAFCLYNDVSGLFTSEMRPDLLPADDPPQDAADVPMSSVSATTATAVSNIATVASSSLDEEDELLYGDSEIPIAAVPQSISDPNATTSRSDRKTNSDPQNRVYIRQVKEKATTHWLFVARKNSTLEIYSVPDYKLVYCIKNFTSGANVLVDAGEIDATVATQNADSVSVNHPPVREILAVGLGLHRFRPTLFLRLSRELFIYEAFESFDNPIESHLKIRFKKNTSHFIYIDDDSTSGAETAEESAGLSNGHAETQDTSRRTSDDSSKDPNRSDLTFDRWLIPFDNVATYRGVFFCGPTPVWFLMSHRGILRAHEMTIDGRVSSFAPFNNVNSDNGFIHFSSAERSLRFSLLPNHLWYDTSFAVRKVALRNTVHHVSYHVESKTYCIVLSRPEPVRRIVRIAAEEKDYDDVERFDEPRYIPAETEQFFVSLFSPLSWDLIPATRIDMEEWEHVTCLKNVSLKGDDAFAPPKSYMVVSTNYSFGEDVSNRGRIHIYDIIDVVPEPGQPLTRSKIKTVYSKEQKGPVTALGQCRGLLMTAIGQKIYLWQLKDKDLIGIAFIDTLIYIHQAACVKNMILVADVTKSVTLLRYQESMRTLSFVGKDIRQLDTYACDFIVSEPHLHFVVSDSEKNLIIFSYEPESIESCGGTRLLRMSEFHLGTHINAFSRLRFNSSSAHNKQITLYAALDGSLGYVMPVDDVVYRRLLTLQTALTSSLQHLAGLNPKAFRQHKSSRKTLSQPTQPLLDLNLLERFLHLSISERVDLARRVNSSAPQLIRDLWTIRQVASYF